MTLAKFLLSLIHGVLIFTFVYAVTGSIGIPQDLFYLIAVVILFAIAIIMHQQLLSFLAVDLVFITRIIAISLLVGLTLYIMDMLVPEFYIHELSLSSGSIGGLIIEDTVLSKYATIALISGVSGFIGTLLIILNGKKK